MIGFIAEKNRPAEAHSALLDRFSAAAAIFAVVVRQYGIEGRMTAQRRALTSEKIGWASSRPERRHECYRAIQGRLIEVKAMMNQLSWRIQK